MDTNPYSHILNALGTQAKNQSERKLTIEQETDNYNVFSELMKQGVSLPDLLSEIDTLKAKVKNIEENPRQNTLNQELFEVMEAAVKSDPEVKVAKQNVANAKSEVIHELCMKDSRYKERLDEYRTAVNAAYIRSKEKQTS